ncbi:MurR/RpiR family transcriptional regulator [Streptomyces ochraceiscleroticus]|uniref:MurR/RpiR family transcriptional regulator n=1 Tax=Streptomyces ochraceiscleroticus TaxID=47761 RepID=A0ABW1MJS5_9ACTN|nr:MurR/RpiR family transcriptional regulator [Streptomyces ochraceiscleroticus]
MSVIETWLRNQEGYAALGPQAERVVRVLVREPHFASYASAREVAERAGANTSTVVRTCQQLGFDGWPALREGLRDLYLDGLTGVGSAPNTAQDAAARMLQRDAANVQTLMAAESVEAIRRVAEAVRSARRTLVVGSGTAAAPAHILGHLGTIMGYDIQLALGAPTVQAARLSHLQAGDCVIAINVWRLTRALRGLTRLAREQGATVCVLTDLHSSPLAEDADHLVVTPIEGLHSTPSLTAMVSAVQAIVAELGASPDRLRSVGRVEHAWNELDLMDDQP